MRIHNLYSKLNTLNLNLVAFTKMLGIDTLPETIIINATILFHAFNILLFGFCALLRQTYQLPILCWQMFFF